MIPHPPHAARRVSGLRVRDTSLGARHVWEANFAWEGADWLEALEAACPDTTSAVRVLGYLSEPPEVRRGLALEARARLRRRGVQARVTVRCSYKPALFWLLEEVLPALRQYGADLLVVRYPVVPDASEGRFLQELYPASTVLEREGIRFEALPASREDTAYEAVAFTGEPEVWRGVCLAPQSDRTLAGQRLLSPTGWLELRVGDGWLVQQRIPTDGERFWSWYETEVMPQLLALSTNQGPFFQSLAVTAKLSEPDVALSVEPERASMLEALSEEVYFSTLEAYQRHVDAPAGGRGLKVGKIVPVFTEALGQSGCARVTLTMIGDGQLGARDADGTVRLVPSGRIRARSVKQPDGTVAVRVSGTPEALERIEHHHALETSGAIPAWESVWPTRADVVIRGDRGKRFLVAPPAVEMGASLVPLPGGPLSARDIWRETHRLGQLQGTTTSLIGRSVEGRPILALCRALNPEAPTLLVTSGQHANEPTGPKAALALFEYGLGDIPINVVAVPLKNPDGLRLYRALRQIHPEHMHHPARYTALGVDVEATPDHEGAALGRALSQFRPRVHLNLHGYPSHEWTRPYTGYAPRGFELWAVPMGAMVIVVHDRHQKSVARELAAMIATDLVADEEIRERTLQALRQRAPHVQVDPFELMAGLPFQFWEREARSRARGWPSHPEEHGTITVITEMPDETIYGQRFDLGVRTQALIGRSVARWVQNTTFRDGDR